MPIHFTIDHKARHVEAKFDGNRFLAALGMTVGLFRHL